MLYVPIGIYLGNIAGHGIVRALLMQAGWVAAGYVLARFAWRRGIKKYAAFGG